MVLVPGLPGWLDPTDAIRLQAFVMVFLLLAMLERAIPARDHHWRGRAHSHGGLQLVNAGLVLAISFAAPIALSAVTLAAQFNHFGLFNHVELGLWTRIVIAWLVLDLVSYWWHRAWHRVPLLWRFHRIHHLDAALDITTTFRTHPLETVATLLCKAAVVYFLGVPLLGIILYEVIVMTMALWCHANIRLHPVLDRPLGLILVTPAIHRQHHAVDAREAGRNFGLVLTTWDRLFGTFRAPGTPVSGPGLADSPRYEPAGLLTLLGLPFTRSATSMES